MKLSRSEEGPFGTSSCLEEGNISELDEDLQDIDDQLASYHRPGFPMESRMQSNVFASNQIKMPVRADYSARLQFRGRNSKIPLCFRPIP